MDIHNVIYYQSVTQDFLSLWVKKEEQGAMSVINSNENIFFSALNEQSKKKNVSTFKFHDFFPQTAPKIWVSICLLRQAIGERSKDIWENVDQGPTYQEYEISLLTKEQGFC